MQQSLAEQLATFVNTASFDEGAIGGLVPNRLPRDVRAKIGDPFLSFASAEASGTTLRFSTTADIVHLRVSTSALLVPDFPRANPSLVVRSGAFEEVLQLDAGTIEFNPQTGAVRIASGPVQDLLLHRAPGDGARLRQLLVTRADVPLAAVLRRLEPRRDEDVHEQQ